MTRIVKPLRKSDKKIMSKTFREIVEENGDKIVHWRDATDPRKKYVCPFNYSENRGGSVDSFRYYNDYLVEINN